MQDLAELDFRPFRHDVSRPQNLPKQCRQARFDERYFESSDAYLAELSKTCGALIAKCDDAEKVFFVGRSPEGLYEYLRAAYKDTAWADRFGMFLFSCRIRIENMSGISTAEEWRACAPKSRFLLRPYMHDLGLTPEAIIKRKRPTTLVDFVYAGTTMNCLFYLLAEWCVEDKLDLPGMLTKLRVVSIEREEKREESWQEYGRDPLHENGWVYQLGTRRVRRIWAREWFWRYSSEDSAKSCPSYTSEKWGCEREVEYNIEGLELCVAHYHYGESRKGRAALRNAIVQQNEMRWPWLESWLAPLREGACAAKKGTSTSHNHSKGTSKSTKTPASKFREFREFDDGWIRNIAKELDQKYWNEQRIARDKSIRRRREDLQTTGHPL